jgi:hypothetical protein
MTIFGVLDSSANGGTFEVEKCHINIWHLQGRVQAHFLCDVGVLLRATASVQSFGLMLPFGTSGTVEDLFSRLQSADTDTLVFGELVTVRSSGETAELEFTTRSAANTLTLARVDAGSSRRDDRSTDDFSLWTIQLYRPLAAGVEAYYRVRFQISGLARTWTWKRAWPLQRNGALIDLRINDTRELVGDLRGWGLERRLKPLVDLYVFLISPWGWQVRGVSPPLRYSRVLEGGAWFDYLGHRIKWRSRSRALVHYWRWAPDEAPNESGDAGGTVAATWHKELKARRAFMDLSRDVPILPWVNYVRLLMLVALIGAVSWFVYFGASGGASVPWKGVLAVAGSGAIITLVTWGASHLASVGKAAHWMHQRVREADLRSLQRR